MNINNETITRYLRNELSSKELSEFTLQMVMNPGLRTEVAAMRTVLKTLKTTDLPKSGSSRFLVLAIGALLVSALAFFYFNQEEAIVTPSKEEQIQKSSRPIAAAFKENKLFEQAMKGLRGKIDFLAVNLPEKDASFALVNGSVNLTFSGKAKTDTGKILLTIWSNRIEDYQNEVFVFQQEISVEESADFKLEKDLALSEGLYYFIINEDQYFGKFLVKK